jgi:hypothetical protein
LTWDTSRHSGVNQTVETEMLKREVMTESNIANGKGKSRYGNRDGTRLHSQAVRAF